MEVDGIVEPPRYSDIVRLRTEEEEKIMSKQPRQTEKESSIAHDSAKTGIR